MPDERYRLGLVLLWWILAGFTVLGAQDPLPGNLERLHVGEILADSSLEDLSEWALRLGISNQGTKEVLSARIREYFQTAVSPESGLASPIVADQGSPTPPESDRLLTIRHAGDVSYFTIEEIQGDFIRLHGGVVLELNDKKQKVTHIIEAREVLISQKDEYMTARGDVRYQKIGETREELRGAELYFNSGSSESWLLDGMSLAAGNANPESRVYQASSSYRSADGVSILRDAELSNSVWDPPAYRIQAKSLYILQPGEWFIEGALLYLGHIPMFYLPYFYNPSDTIVFHPSSGYKLKEGTYIQTTTYFLGRKGSEQAFLDLLKFSLPDTGDDGNYEEVLKGIYLRKTGKAKDTGPDSGTAKLLVDAYTRLGYFAGFLLSPKNVDPFKRFDLGIGVAWSKNLYASNGLYTDQYVEGGIGRIVPSSSNFYGLELPARYFFDFASELDLGAVGSLRVQFPLYSDPAVRYDFSEREEEFNWGKFTGITSSETASQANASPLSARSPVKTRLDWSVVLSPGAASLKLPPLLDSLQLKSLENIMVWKSVALLGLAPEVSTASDSASKTAFMPENLLAPKIELGISGTLFRYPFATPAQTSGSVDIMKPWSEELPQASEGGPPPVGKEPADDEARYWPPLVKIEKAPIQQEETRGFLASSSWSLSPNLELRAFFPSNAAETAGSLDYNPDYWSISRGVSGTLSSQMGLGANLARITSALSIQDRTRAILAFNDRLDATSRQQIIDQAGKDGFSTIAHSLGIRIEPLSHEWFKQTSMSYDLAQLLYGRVYDSTSLGSEPRWIGRMGEWNKTDVTRHEFKAELRSAIETWSANASMTSTLPPKDELYTIQYGSTYGFAFGSLGVRSGASWGSNKPFAYDKLQVNSRLNGTADPNNPGIVQNLVIDQEKGRPDRYDVSILLGPLSMSLAASNNRWVRFDTDTLSFTAEKDEKFQVDQYRMGFNAKGDLPTLWNNRLRSSYSLELSYFQSMVDVKNASLGASASFVFGIHEFMDLGLKLKSANRSMFRYFGAYSERLGVASLNLLEDLAMSFNFFNIADRQRSSFKFQSVEASVIHYLGDWDLKLAYSANPKEVLSSGVRSFNWETLFSFELAWKPLPILQKKISYKNETLSEE